MKGKLDNYKWATDWLLSTKYNPKARSGRLPVISADDKAIVSLVFDSLSSHRSIALTTNFVCEVQKRKGLGQVSCPAIYGLVGQLGGKQVATKKQQQGSNDPTSDWAVARWGQCLQIVIRARATIFDTPEEVQEWIKSNLNKYLEASRTAGVNKVEVEAKWVREADDNNDENRLVANDNYPFTWPPCFQL